MARRESGAAEVEGEPIAGFVTAPSPDPLEESVATLEPAARDDHGRNRKILLAEDDSALRSLLAVSLKKDGHEITEAADGTEILEVLAADCSTTGRFSFDLVISDVRMPGWSGLDVLVGIRQLADPPPVLLITAFGDDHLHDQAFQLGAVATLDKPFDLDDFRALVRGTLGSPRAGSSERTADHRK
jgi:DNA-binding response OmpR family regulator